MITPLRLLLALGLLGSGLSAVPAGAASACPLLSDPAGDATSDPLSTGNRDDLDIVSASIKVTGGTLTSLMRIKNLAEGSDLAAGDAYYVYVTRDGVEYAIRAALDASGPTFTVQTGSLADPTAPYRSTQVTGSIDHRHEVRVVAPLTAFSLDGSRGTSRRFSDVLARTTDLKGGNETVYVGSSADDAGGSASYTIGQRPCF